jgi:hypothetical protein
MSWLNGISRYSSPGYQGLFYYGTHREGRVDYFERYFSKVLYPVYISTYGNTNTIEFSKYNKTIKFVSAFDSIKQIASFSLSLYIEDKESHTLYCSPANRFYECLAAGLPMVFDRSCVNTMKTAGYDISDFVVDHSFDIMKNINVSRRLWGEQKNSWYRDYYKEFENEFDTLASKELK